MLIAQEKLESNIAEYILYMYHLEDILRAFQFDMDTVSTNLIQPQVKNPEEAEVIEEWYEEIIHEMKTRGLETKGHLFRINELITELVYLHKTLKDVVKNPEYLELLAKAEPNVSAFIEKSDLNQDVHIIEVCLQALYMKLLLRIQKKDISDASEKAFDSMRMVLTYLTKAFHQMKKGDMSMFE